MSEVKRFTPDNSGSMLAAVVWDSDGGWVRYKDHEAEVERLTNKRDAAQAEVERLTQELEGRRATNQRVIAERDAARAEAERLQTLLTVERGELATLRDSLRVLRASGQGMLDTSRPTDETIWWKAFNSFLRDHSLTIEEVADQAQAALTIYRARWPR